MLKKQLLRGLSALIAVLILVGSMPMMYVFAEEDSSSDAEFEGLHYTINQYGEVAITGYTDYTGVTTFLTIPSSISGYPVTVIAEGAFVEERTLKEIVIPDSVAYIEKYAFDDCTGLKYLYIPKSVSYIETYAFNGCSNLEIIEVDANNIWYDSRDNCNAIIRHSSNELILGCKNTVIPDTVVSIGEAAFKGCYGSSELNIPDSVKFIGNYAFADCYNIESVTIPVSLQYINPFTFSYCIYLKRIVLPVEIGVGMYAFDSCWSLSDVYYCGTANQWPGVIYGPEGNDFLINANIHYNYRDNKDIEGLLYEIDEDSECVKITEYIGTAEELVIPDTIEGYPVDRISAGAFRSCESLTSVTIPDSVMRIEDSAFENCANLKSITLPKYMADIRNYAFYGCTSLESIIIPEGIPSIGDYTFDGCSNLSSVTLPEDITSIGKGAFFYCTSLKSIELPEGITNIGDYAFQDCTGLEGITIPKSVTTIGKYTFYGCTSLGSIVIPEGVTSIDYYAFSCCPGVTSISVDANNTTFNSKNNCNAIINSSTNELLFGCQNTVIPDDATSIWHGAFYGCTGLKSITIPESVTNIGNYGFSGCEAIESIVIPDSVTSMGTSVFSDCINLKSVTLPKEISSINDHSFSRCTSLESITIPESVTSIGKYAFYYCEKLGGIIIPEGVTSIDEYAFSNCVLIESVTIPEGVKILNNCIFSRCSNLKSIQLPEGLTTIEHNAFNKCTSLKSITIPESVTSIELRVFENCESIESIVIPKGVTDIEAYTFKGCISLSNIEMHDGITSIGMSAFYGCTALEDVALPDSLSTIELYTFAECTGLKSISIPETVTTINQYAFKNCTSLSDVYFGGTEEQWNAIDISSDYNPELINATIHFPGDTEATSVVTDPTESEAISEPVTDASTADEVEPSESVATDATETSTASEPVTEAATIDETEPTESVTTVATEAVKEYYTVVFVDYNGRFISAQTVKPGEAATSPESPSRTGYTFTGWDTEFTNVTSDLTITAQYSRNSIPVSTATVGSLKVEVVGGTGFRIAVNDGTVRTQGASYVNSKMAIGAKVTLVAFSTSDAEFIGWMNSSSGTILSASETYSFIATGNDYVKAMYKSVIEGINLVTFTNAEAAGGNGQVLDMQYYAAGDEIAFPDAPSRVGYDFAGWNMSAEAIQAELAIGNDVLIDATWVRAIRYVTVSVTGGTVNGAESAQCTAYSSAIAVANEAPTGEKFAYWTNGKGQVVSYDAEYSFYPADDTVLTANYVASDAAIEYQAIVGLSADPTSDGEYINYTMTWDVPESVGTVTMAGLMIVNAEDYSADTFYHGTADEKVFDRALGSAQIMQKNTYAINKGASNYDNTYFACTWVIYTDAKTGESVTVYSDMVEVTKQSA